MHRRLFVELSPQEQTAFVQALQERRLRVVTQYAELQAAKQAAAESRLRDALADQLRMMERDIGTMERALGKIEDRLHKANALRQMIAQGMGDE